MVSDIGQNGTILKDNRIRIDVDFLSVLEKPVLDDEAEINGRNNIPDAEDPRSGH